MTEPGPGPGRAALMGRLDLALKIVGAIVATGLGAAAGIYEALLSPLHVAHSSVYLPVTLVLAIVGNPALAWFAYAVTGRRAAVILPAGAWCLVWFAGASRTTEGDLIITGTGWVGLATLLAGPIAFALGVFVPTMRKQQQALRSQPPAR
jgi:hypothetical protein